MIILKSFSTATETIDFKCSIISRAKPWINGFHRSDGLYAKVKDYTITVINVENNYSLRGANPNICFYGMIIRLCKKEFLFGYIGPSMFLTIFTLLMLISPYEYFHIRIIALLFWVIVYFGNMNRINDLRKFILSV